MGDHMWIRVDELEALRARHDHLADAFCRWRQEAYAERDALRAERDDARAEIARWRQLCDDVGIPPDGAALVAHHRANASLTAEAEARARIAELEAEVERLREREESARQDALEADR